MATKPPITYGDDGRTPTTAVQQTDTNWAQLTGSGDGYHVTVGAKADAAATSGTGTFSVIALLKGILTKLLGTLTVTLTGSLPSFASTPAVKADGSNLAQPLVVAPAMTFSGKTAGQTFDVPHVYKYRNATTFGAPTVFTLEPSTTEYAKIATSGDGSMSNESTSVNGEYGQGLFSFDLLNDLKNRGLIPKSWTATELKAALKYLYVTWVGYGVGSNGGVSTNGAQLKAWAVGSSAWVGSSSNTASSPQVTVYTTSSISDRIDSNGFLHILTYSTYPSDGTIASTIYTDYIKVDVQLSPEYLLTDGVLTYDSTNKASRVTLATAVPTGANTIGAVNQQGYTGAAWEPVRVANVFKFAAGSVANGGTLTLWTPATGKKFRLMGFVITSDAAGSLSLRDGGTGIGAVRPSASLTTLTVNLGQGKISAAANNVFDLVNNTGAVAYIQGWAWGTEE